MILTKKTILRPLAGLFLGLALTGTAFGQAGTTADRSADVNVFAGVSHVDPDYGEPQVGYVFGADYTRFFRHLYAAPSLELRATISPKGRTVGENVYSGGLKLEHLYHRRYHAYVDALAGWSKINFVIPAHAPGGIVESSDTGLALTYGGGVDVDVFRNYAVKADFQGSSWRGLDIGTLSPSALTVGVVYHIPAHFGHRE